MDLQTIERLIDEAIDAEDYEKVLRLLQERESILKSHPPSPEIAREILRRDEERIKRIKEKKADLLRAIRGSRKLGESLKGYERSYGEQQKRSWGKG